MNEVVPAGHMEIVDPAPNDEIEVLSIGEAREEVTEEGSDKPKNITNKYLLPVIKNNDPEMKALISRLKKSLKDVAKGIPPSTPYYGDKVTQAICDVAKAFDAKQTFLSMGDVVAGPTYKFKFPSGFEAVFNCIKLRLKSKEDIEAEEIAKAKDLADKKAKARLKFFTS